MLKLHVISQESCPAKPLGRSSHCPVSVIVVIASRDCLTDQSVVIVSLPSQS
jgi:hypothetical protein